MFARSPSTFYSRIEINKGSKDGVEVNDPVVNGEGLVGKVLSVSGPSSVVMLLTDQDFGVSALDAKSSEPLSVEAAPGTPGDLLIDFVPNARAVRRGDSIVTAGTTSERLPSPFPPGILIGIVSRVDIGEGDLDRRIHVKPAADLRRLDTVRVLTKPAADLQSVHQVIWTPARHRPPRAAVPDRRHLPADRRLAVSDLRRPGRPHAAADRLRGPAGRARSRAPRSASRSGCSWTRRCCRRSG